ncbi:transcriptional regulator, AraC family [Emticicia oligotrophica DSM 17448]|uniref:Transcriptional regulator, AraC family n=1 Tax=Emticicia oligotrophica (strain DSM 17448 / CIP 109782 / MTCC 6937 / GPTSA100-15) TaxID=929562 RepID=A0ABM5N6M2_EMTOG|nr:MULTISPECIES: AraC family transcriptional regulator [Emticicia]AFK05101.1 transcriptional regulator, AraC family [Emticicia oligotrophica DSM 17448]
MSTFHHEITPLTPHDCFMVFNRQKKDFDFPIHFHDEYEINFIENAKGARRVVGDSNEAIDYLELTLVGPNLPHAWLAYQSDKDDIHEITIQFHRDLFDNNLLQRNQLNQIKDLLERSTRGVVFSKETIEKIKPRLIALTQKSGFESVIELIAILHELSISNESRLLTSGAFSSEKVSFKSRRIEKAFEFMRVNYHKDISLEDIAQEVNMAEVSFSRFIKKRTGKTFIDSLNDIRLGHATRLLIDTSLTISEISFKCGYNNLSYFNRVFKKKYSITPKEFRDNYTGTKTFV